MKPLYILMITIIAITSCAQKSISAKHNKKMNITVMCYNIHHGNPPSKPGVIDVTAIADVIKKQNADVVALQEVDVNTRRSGNINEAELISEKAGYPYYYFAKAINHDGGEYGVAILSKHQLIDTITLRLPTKPSTNGEPRVLALATLQLPGGEKIRMACTHLDAQKQDDNRLLQIDKIVDYATSEKLPLIIAGDFNAEPDSKVIQTLDKKFTRTCTQCEPTIPQVNATKAIDFIAFSPKHQFSVLQHRVIKEEYASDHLPIVATLQFLHK